jgi:hypothetical protein
VKARLHCSICYRKTLDRGFMCAECRRAYDAHLKPEDGTMIAALAWAARRARRFARSK